MLDIKRLRYLDAVYRYKNYTRASEELRVSQPAISAAINAWEEEIGIRLIVRSSREVRFTFEGEQLVLRARRILKECEQTEEMLEELSGVKNSTLHLGVSPPLTMRLLPHIYRNFFSKWPNAKIDLDEASMTHQLEKIRDNSLDLSYNALPKRPDLSAFRLIPVVKSQVYAVMNPDHPLAAHEKISIQTLEGVPICLPDEKSLIWELMMENFRESGVTPTIVSRHEQLLCMFHMIRYGGYVGFSNVEGNTPLFSGAGEPFVIRPFETPIQFDAGFIIKSGKRLPKIGRELVDFVIRTQSEWDHSL